MSPRRFLIGCASCGAHTSRAYARTHEGKCKACFTGIPRQDREETAEHRNARIIDSGWQAYAREEGHYDGPDY